MGSYARIQLYEEAQPICQALMALWRNQKLYTIDIARRRMRPPQVRSEIDIGETRPIPEPGTGPNRRRGSIYHRPLRTISGSHSLTARIKKASQSRFVSSFTIQANGRHSSTKNGH